MQFREGSRLWCPGWCPEKWQISLGWLPFSSCSQKRLSTSRKLHRTFSMQVTAVGVRGVCVVANELCPVRHALFWWKFENSGYCKICPPATLYSNNTLQIQGRFHLNVSAMVFKDSDKNLAIQNKPVFDLLDNVLEILSWS